MNLAQKIINVLERGGGGQTPAEAYAEIVLAQGSGPVTYWKLDEESGTTATNYGSLSSANGTYSAADIAGGSTGPFGGTAPLFVPGDTDHVNVYTAALDGTWTTDNTTLSFWYRYDGNWGTSTGAALASFREDANNRLLIDKSTTNTLRIYFAADGNVVNSAVDMNATGLNDGNWHHFFMTMNVAGNAQAVYIDNVSRATGTCAARATTGLNGAFATIGSEDTTPSDPMEGSIAHFAYYQTVLDATARTALYNGGPL